MIEVLKEEINKPIEEIYEYTNKKVEIISKIIQDLKIGKESTKKIQTEGNLGAENL